MSLKYGLNLGAKKTPAPRRKTIFDDDEDEVVGTDSRDEVEEEEISSLGRHGAPKEKSARSRSPPRKIKPPFGLSKPPSRKKDVDDEEIRQDASSAAAAEARKKQAEELDPSIFDYDSYHEAKSTVTEAKKAAARQDAVERKPKYINNLMEAAERRKQDQLVAREKLLQKERENEGEEFADKEKFVTGAYKAHQEEARKIEEVEKKRAEEEEERRRKQGGGMQGFYKNMMEQSERQHQETMEAAARIEKEGGMKQSQDSATKGKTDTELAAELKAKGVHIHINEEGQVSDKRQLLNAGLNVAPATKSGANGAGADHLKSSNRRSHPGYERKVPASQQAQRERQSRMLEEQLAATTKRTREEEEEENAKLEKAAKSQKSESAIGDAKARYLARKAAKERGEG